MRTSFVVKAPQIRDVQRLMSQYGGTASDWGKLSTRSVQPMKVQNYAMQTSSSIEIHYYKNVTTGQIVELKSVFTNVK